MELFDQNGWLVAIVIGVAAGWIAEQLTGRRHGVLVNLAVGLVGALIGWWLAGVLAIPITGWLGSLAASTAGALILLVVFGLVRRR